MWKLVKSKEFDSRISGNPLTEFQFDESDEQPSAFSLKFGSLNGDIKGHLISSLTLDWALMEELTPASAKAASDFDSLQSTSASSIAELRQIAFAEVFEGVKN